MPDKRTHRQRIQRQQHKVQQLKKDNQTFTTEILDSNETSSEEKD